VQHAASVPRRVQFDRHPATCDSVITLEGGIDLPPLSHMLSAGHIVVRSSPLPKRANQAGTGQLRDWHCSEPGNVILSGCECASTATTVSTRSRFGVSLLTYQY
jgi:hypothetical protein